jgi:hypothetical protein
MTAIHDIERGGLGQKLVNNIDVVYFTIRDLDMPERKPGAMKGSTRSDQWSGWPLARLSGCEVARV